ncbi:MAG: VapE family protein [Thiobacillus sp.]|nr:VapE family protein [Thiobacillus sp.]
MANEPLGVAFDAIPASLASVPQWLLWRFEANEGEKKPRKMPYYVSGGRRTGEQGSAADRAHLVDLATARAAMEKNAARWTGVGFAFLPGDGLIGVDLDGMIDADGVMNERARNIIAACASYTELSPSGKGVHIICAGDTKSFKSNEVGVEVFCGRQYFTFTGHHYSGTPATVEAMPATALNRLRATVESGKKKPTATAPANAPAPALQGRSKVESALAFVSADCGYDDWIRVGMAICSELGDGAFDVFDAWSAKGSNYPGSAQVASHWKSFKPGSVTGATIFKQAMDQGWQPPKQPRKRAQPAGGQSTPVEAGAGDSSWRGVLLRKDDRLIDCRENVYLMLTRHPAWAGALWADEFARKIVKRKPAPWDTASSFEYGQVWGGDDDLRLGLWMAQQERLVVRSTDSLAAAVGWAARESRCHPVREYLDALVWDGVPRVGSWLTDFMGVKETDYTKLVASMFLIGMVARIYEPGCMMRSMPIFEGAQFRGKSSAVAVLGGEWYGDTPIDLNSKDAYQVIQGRWLYEIAELDAFNRAESTRIKAFISSREDRFRAPYDREVKDWQRNTLFFGTTNQDEYFKDQTGNSRYWPLRAEEVGRINLAGLAAARDQMFAEAVALYRKGRRWHPTQEQQRTLFEPEQADREIADPWQSMIAKWLRGTLQDRVMVTDVLGDCLKIDASKIDSARQMSTRIGIAMKRLGWIKRRETGGDREYYYLRPDTGWDHNKGITYTNEDGGDHVAI